MATAILFLTVHAITLHISLKKTTDTLQGNNNATAVVWNILRLSMESPAQLHDERVVDYVKSLVPQQ